MNPTMKNRLFTWLPLSAALIAMALHASGAEKNPWISDEQRAKLISAALLFADKVIEDAQKELQRLDQSRRPKPGDDIVRRKAEMVMAYSKHFKEKHRLRGELDAMMTLMQQEIRQANEDEVLQLQQLDRDYWQASDGMRTLARDYQAQFRQPLPDPLTRTIMHFFPIDPTKARDANDANDAN